MAMQLIALLVVLVLAGVGMARLGGGVLSPKAEPAASPSQTLRQVERATEAASQAERQRLEQTMKALR